MVSNHNYIYCDNSCNMSKNCQQLTPLAPPLCTCSRPERKAIIHYTNLNILTLIKHHFQSHPVAKLLSRGQMMSPPNPPNPGPPGPKPRRGKPPCRSQSVKRDAYDGNIYYVCKAGDRYKVRNKVISVKDRGSDTREAKRRKRRNRREAHREWKCTRPPLPGMRKGSGLP
jgi:hypothetical protein